MSDRRDCDCYNCRTITLIEDLLEGGMEVPEIIMYLTQAVAHITGADITVADVTPEECLETVH